MVTICAVAGDEGADQMTEALINWPLMNKEMQEVRPLVCRYIFWGGGVSLPVYHEFVFVPGACLCCVFVVVVLFWRGGLSAFNVLISPSENMVDEKHTEA